MSEATAIRIANVKYAGTGLRLIVRWTNNKEMTVNLEEPVYRLKGLRPLRTQAVFARAGVGEDGCSVVWPGDIDMGADRLWEMALGPRGRCRVHPLAVEARFELDRSCRSAWLVPAHHRLLCECRTGSTTHRSSGSVAGGCRRPPLVCQQEQAKDGLLVRKSCR